MAISLSRLNQALHNDTIIRTRIDLQPLSGDGLVYPPTYDKGKHIFRKGFVDGECVDTVLLDSPQSQSNRLELALLAAIKADELAYPDIRITAELSGGTEHYSVLQLSHRNYDAALYACVDEAGTPYLDTDIGRSVSEAIMQKASRLYEHAPLTLLLGGWDSHRGSSPTAAKIPRAFTSEVVGIHACPAERGATKFDPMDVRKGAGPIYLSSGSERYLTTDPKQAVKSKKKKEGAPSEVGLGNVPNLEQRGATIAFARQTSLISLTQLRRLRFEDADGQFDAETEQAARVVIAALGLYGLARMLAEGFDLRSGCLLMPIATPRVEILGATAQESDAFELTPVDAKQLLDEAILAAEGKGLSWREPVAQFSAGAELRQLLERSRELAVSETTEEE